MKRLIRDTLCGVLMAAVLAAGYSVLAEESNSSSSNDSQAVASKASDASSQMASASQAASAAASNDVWQKGGLATNQVSSGPAKTQEAISKALAIWGIATNGLAFALALMPEERAMPIINAVQELVVVPTGGPVGWWINFDFMGLAVDGLLLSDAMNKTAVWSEDIPELQAAVRQIAEPEDLSEECEAAEEGEEGDDAAGTKARCNSLNAKLDGTEVHVSTLQNVGLEALEDVAGTILKSPEELMAAAPYIKEGFGTTTTEITKKVNGEEVTASRTLTDADNQAMDLRKKGHLQLTGTAGVARADLGTTVAISEKAISDRLREFVGADGGLVGNAKRLCGLDLILAQRLNLLNMLYGQQAANEAAAALQLLQNK